jgi:hypothetical protein
MSTASLAPSACSSPTKATPRVLVSTWARGASAFAAHLVFSQSASLLSQGGAGTTGLHGSPSGAAMLTFWT